MTTPMGTTTALDADEDGEPMDQKEYRSVDGCYHCQLFGNKQRSIPSIMYKMFISDYFHKFWMSCACRDLCAKMGAKPSQTRADRPAPGPVGRALSRLGLPLHQSVTQAQGKILHVELGVGLIKGPERLGVSPNRPDFRPYEPEPTQNHAEPPQGGDQER